MTDQPPIPGSRPSESAGYTLVAALLTLVGISFLATAGFMVALGNQRVSQAELGSVRSFYAADSGLNLVLGSTVGYPADTTVLSSPTDTVVITATRLVEMAAGRRLYVLRSRGRHHSPDGSVSVRSLSVVLWADPDSAMRRPAVERGTWREEL